MNHPTIVESLIGNGLTWLLIFAAYAAVVVAVAKWLGKHEEWIKDMSESEEDI